MILARDHNIPEVTNLLFVAVSCHSSLWAMALFIQSYPWDSCISSKKHWGGIKFTYICPNIAISGYRTLCMRSLFFCQKKVFKEVLHLLPFSLLWLCNIMHEILVIIFMKMFVQYMWSAASFIFIIWNFLKQEYIWF